MRQGAQLAVCLRGDLRRRCCLLSIAHTTSWRDLSNSASQSYILPQGWTQIELKRLAATKLWPRENRSCRTDCHSAAVRMSPRMSLLDAWASRFLGFSLI